METIVQIGVANAKDHVFDYIKNKNFENIFAIFIEPNVHSLPLIKKHYELLKTKIISNIAITTYNGIVPIYFNDYETGDSQMASINEKHLYDHGLPSERIKKVDIKCLTLNTYLNDLIGFDKNTIIDCLHIDTEGHDCDIILSTDFSKLNVLKIYFEITHTEHAFSGFTTEKFDKTKNYLIQNGYDIDHYDQFNGSVLFTKKI